MTPTILGGLHGIRAVRTTSFEVLVSPPSLDSVGQAVGCCNRLSKTPSGIGAQVEAFVDRSSATTLSARGMQCRSRTSKPFSSFWVWSRYTVNWGSLQPHSPLTCLMINWESLFTSSCRTLRDGIVLSLRMRVSYSTMLLVALKSRCTMYLNAPNLE
jgi:hypothetical protein